MAEIIKPYALVTGASSGIGRELAELFARDGIDVIVTARDREVLKRLSVELHTKYGVTVELYSGDLGDQSVVDGLYDFCRTKSLTVGYVVNNAGFGDYGKFQSADWQRLQDMVNLNILSLTHLTHLFLPDMLKRKSGRILNVASMAGFFSGPNMAVYYATKAYVLHFSEALSYELQNSGVTVTTLCPGATETKFASSARATKTALFSRHLASAAAVAACGFNAMNAGKTTAIYGLQNRSLIWFIRFLPRKLVTRLVARTQG